MNLEALLAVHQLDSNSKTQVMVLEDLDMEALKSVLRRAYIS